jgi:acyl-CoA dehydrogenase
MASDAHSSTWQTEEVGIYRESVRRFIRSEFVPQLPQWRERHSPGTAAWQSAGRAGVLLPDIPASYGGGGGTFAHECVVTEELSRAGVPFGSGVQGVVAHYIHSYGTEEQKRKWLPPMALGDRVGAIAMTEPGAGSDLAAIATTARKDGGHYVINGSKTFITNGQCADLVCVVAKTNPTAPAMRALSIIVVEARDLPGFSVSRPLEKVGMHERDTCELYFQDVRVPVENLLGTAEGNGFSQMMQQLPFERLSLAVAAIAMAEEAVAMTTRYVKQRLISGKPLFDMQNTRFKLAECAAEVRVGRVFVDDCIGRYVAGRFDAVSAAIAKYWLTERQCRIVDECLQLHGGYGYMTEYAIARMWVDSRVQRIYGGTNEIMKEVIAWSL